jgi:hypothetical protein
MPAVAAREPGAAPRMARDRPIQPVTIAATPNNNPISTQDVISATTPRITDTTANLS